MHKRIIAILFLVMTLLSVNWAVAQEKEDTPPARYRIGIADVLEITVIPEGDPASLIAKLVNVRPDGFFSFEYVGEIYAAGKTIPEVAAILEERLKQLFTTVDVTINLKVIRAKRYFVMGEVTKPGEYPLDGRKTVLDAIATAGSYTRFASLNHVLLVRETPQGAKIYRIPLKDVIKKGKFQFNRELQNGDIVFVPETGWAKMGNFFYKIIYPFRDILGVAVSISAAYIIYDRTAR